MKLYNLLALVIIFFYSGCNNFQNKPQKTIAAKSENDSIVVVKKPYKNTQNVTEYEIPVIKGTGVKHGIQKRYYLHGSLYSEIPYSHGKREGIAKTYYPAALGEQPTVWKEQPYKKNMLNGVCRRYHRNGKLQAEYEYKDGLPATGLKEYSPSGKPVKLPELILTKKNNGMYYYVTARMSDKEKNVDYYMGNLIEGKYLPQNLKQLQVKNGVGEVLLPLKTKKVTITAEIYTEYQNRYLVSKTLSF